MPNLISLSRIVSALNTICHSKGNKFGTNNMAAMGLLHCNKSLLLTEKNFTKHHRIIQLQKAVTI